MPLSSSIKYTCDACEKAVQSETKPVGSAQYDIGAADNRTTVWICATCCYTIVQALQKDGVLVEQVTLVDIVLPTESQMQEGLA